MLQSREIPDKYIIKEKKLKKTTHTNRPSKCALINLHNRLLPINIVLGLNNSKKKTVRSTGKRGKDKCVIYRCDVTNVKTKQIFSHTKNIGLYNKHPQRI